jgi:WD40 repeat protein
MTFTTTTATDALFLSCPDNMAVCPDIDGVARLHRFADDLSCVTTSNDNKLLAAGCSNGRVMLWDTEARENLWEYAHHTGTLYCFSWGNESRVL